MMAKFISLFPFWVFLTSAFAFFEPSAIIGLKPLIVPLFVLMMFYMGMTLQGRDFLSALRKPKIIILTMILQFTIMPIAAFFIAHIFCFSLELMMGTILLGAVSGGITSNVMAYIAKADVALSITMTVISTMLSVVFTPLLTLFCIGDSLIVPIRDMLIAILCMMIVPVFCGVIVNVFLHQYIAKLKDFFALLAVVAIVFIVAIIVGLNAKQIQSVSFIVILGIILHNVIGLISGYFIAKCFGYNKKICKTVSIEVGMQNASLAVVLAMKYFSSLSALPGAIFSIWNIISVSVMSYIWAKDEK